MRTPSTQKGAEQAPEIVEAMGRVYLLSLLLATSLSSVACSSGDGGGGVSSSGGSGSADFPPHFTSDGRRLADARGQAFLLHGDAAWSLMVMLTKPQVESYLDDRRQKGFNSVLANLIERGYGGPANLDGQLPFVPADDYTAPNQAYFAHADWVIDEAAERDMLVLLTPSYLGFGCGSSGWCEQMQAQSLDAMTAYGRFLGDRYAAKRNILWVHGGDSRASSHGVEAHGNAIANAIRERAPAHLHTGHCSRNNSAIECYDEPWLDLNTTYSKCGVSFDAVRDDWRRTPAIPFFYLEGSYEGRSGDLGCLIDQAAWAILGGATGHVFGNDPIWLFGAGWESALSSPGSLAMQHLGDLFRSRAWFRLEPDFENALLVAGAGDGALAARTDDGESILVYAPTARTLSVDLAPLSGEQAHGWWFDPVDGSSSDLGVFPAMGLTDFAAPGRRILVLDDAAQNLARPGS